MNFGNSKSSKTRNRKTSYSDIFLYWERSYSNKTDTDSCISFLLIANLGIHTHCKQPLKSSMFKDAQITFSTSRVYFSRVIDITWRIVITTSTISFKSKMKTLTNKQILKLLIVYRYNYFLMPLSLTQNKFKTLFRCLCFSSWACFPLLGTATNP